MLQSFKFRVYLSCVQIVRDKCTLHIAMLVVRLYSCGRYVIYTYIMKVWMSGNWGTINTVIVPSRRKCKKILPVCGSSRIVSRVYGLLGEELGCADARRSVRSTKHNTGVVDVLMLWDGDHVSGLFGLAEDLLALRARGLPSFKGLRATIPCVVREKEQRVLRAEDWAETSPRGSRSLG